MTTRIQEFDYSIDLLRALLWQDNKAPQMTALLQQKQAWYDENVSTFWENWVRDVFDIRTANEFGLAVWAIILGVPTSVILPPTNKANFGFNSTVYTVPYQVSYPAEQPISALSIASMYRRDWQGTNQMFSTSRTNILLQSGAFGRTSPWVTPGAGFMGSIAASTDIPAPDGTATAVSKVTVTATSNLCARQTGLSAPAGSRVSSVWVYVPAGQPGVSAFQLVTDWDDTDIGSISSSGILGRWVRLSSVATLTATRAQLDFNITQYPSGATLPIGTVFYLHFGQSESGATARRYIATTTAAASMTDYSNTALGVLTFAQNPTLDPSQDFIYWNGTYTTAGSVAVTALNRQIARTFKQGNKNFGHGNFGSNSSTVAGLTLEQKRILLRLRYFKLISRCTVPEINRMMKSLLGDQGSVYVLDANDMSYITYIFGFQPDSSLAFVLQNFDVLPRPAAVGVRYLVSTRPTFGFGPYFKNFNHGTFGA